MKFLIILMYCDRPNMVRFALDSIASQSYKNYEIAVIDDSCVLPIRPVVDEYIWTSDFMTLYEVGDTIEDKIKNQGSRFGKYVNEAIDNSDATVGLMLCDDDALMPNTLEQLSKFYLNNPVTYSYGHVLTFNPYDATNYEGIKGRYGSSLNIYDQPINAFCKVDASQVSWRLEPYRRAGIKFPHPQTAALDAVVYQQMYDTLGPCHFNGQFVQYKGIFDDQLGLRKDPYRPIDKEFYDTAI